MARISAYLSQSNQKQVQHVQYQILIGIVIRITRTGNDLRCAHENGEVICYVCASINECYGVVGMGNIIDGAVNANISRQGSAVHTLNGACVVGVPNMGVIGASGHDTLSIHKTEEAHESEGGHGN
jgi:hypothetical protein